MIRKLLARVLRGPPPKPPARPAAPAPVYAEEPEEPALEVEAPIPGSLLLDIREPGELGQGVAEGAMLLPMDLVPHHLAELPRDRPITVYCAAGARSYGVAHWLREQGFAEAWSLDGGLDALRRAGVRMAVPPGMRPGTRVTLPGGLEVDGAPAGPAALEGEVVRQVGDDVEVLVRDAQGMPVRVRVEVARVRRRE